jgi:hypothetical protein
MVDFSKLVGQKPAVDASDPLKLFESLDRKGSHTTLRPAQIEALSALHQRRAERDHVLKGPRMNNRLNHAAAVRGRMM